LTIGTGTLTIIPFQELGELGGHEGSPTTFQWYWQYHLYRVAFWGLIVLPLVLFKDNRCLAAWAILIPMMAVFVVFRMIANLLSCSPTNTELLGTLVTSLTSAWAVIWLMAHWLSPQRWLLGFVLAFIVMGATGLLACVCNYGLPNDETIVSILIYHVLASLILLLSMALTGRFRRKAYLSASFVVWLLPWTVLSSILGMLVLMIGLGLFQGSPVFDVDILLEVLLVSSIGGVALYLLNLPFVLLAFRNFFYRNRLCAVFGLQYAGRQVLNEVQFQPHPGQSAEDEDKSSAVPSE
jgi:hypothetical protein